MYNGVAAPYSVGAIDAVLALDCVTREQWDDLHRSTHLTPVQELYFAILDDALRCYTWQAGTVRDGGDQAAEKRRRTLHKEAECWLRGDEPAVVTLQDCCDALGIDVDLLRTKLREWEHARNNDGERPQLVLEDSHLDCLPAVEAA